MEEIKIAGAALPAMPWEERPAGCKDVVWRCSANPIIPRDLLPTSNSIFNSAVVPFKDGYAGVFRCDDTNRRMRLHVGFSKDAVHWDINEEPLKFQCDDAEVGTWVYGYDPRVCFIEDRYYVTWCMAIMVLLSVWPTPMILLLFTSWRMPLFLSIGMESCSLVR